MGLRKVLPFLHARDTIKMSIPIWHAAVFTGNLASATSSSRNRHLRYPNVGHRVGRAEHWGVYRDYGVDIGVIMENQMEKKMENEMETVFI